MSAALQGRTRSVSSYSRLHTNAHQAATVLFTAGSAWAGMMNAVQPPLFFGIRTRLCYPVGCGVTSGHAGRNGIDRAPRRSHSLASRGVVGPRQRRSGRGR
jgi:hypothetical protein